MSKGTVRVQGYGMPTVLIPRGRRGLPLYEYCTQTDCQTFVIRVIPWYRPTALLPGGCFSCQTRDRLLTAAQPYSELGIPVYTN
jgi:hypothetical protein